MKNTTISALVLYTTLSCGVPEEVTPPSNYKASSSSGVESATSGSGLGGSGGNGSGGEYAGGSNNYGGSAGFSGSNAGGDDGGNMNTGGQGGFGGADGAGGYTGAAGNDGVGGSCGDLLGKFITYSQGGWHNSQAAMLPVLLGSNGVMIGDESTDYALFTTADAVTGFLPAGGTPAALQGQYVNPTSTPAGVLAGQALTLKLNVLASPQACGYSLSDLVVTDGLCKDKSVSEVVTLADQALAGMAVPLSYLEISECAEKSNLNFKEGVDNQYLKLP